MAPRAGDENRDARSGGGPAAVDRERRARGRGAHVRHQIQQHAGQLAVFHEGLVRLRGQDDLLDHPLGRDAAGLGLVNDLGLDRETMLTLISLTSAVWIGTTLLAAWASDKITRKTTYLIGFVLQLVWVFPLFLLSDTEPAVMSESFSVSTSVALPLSIIVSLPSPML